MYGRKVEHLHALVYQALDLVVECKCARCLPGRCMGAMATHTPCRKRDVAQGKSAARAHDQPEEDKDSPEAFLSLDDAVLAGA